MIITETFITWENKTNKSKITDKQVLTSLAEVLYEFRFQTRGYLVRAGVIMEHFTISRGSQELNNSGRKTAWLWAGVEGKLHQMSFVPYKFCIM